MSTLLQIDNVGRELTGAIEGLPVGAELLGTFKLVSRATPTVVDYQFIAQLSGISITPILTWAAPGASTGSRSASSAPGRAAFASFFTALHGNPSFAVPLAHPHYQGRQHCFPGGGMVGCYQAQEQWRQAPYRQQPLDPPRGRGRRAWLRGLFRQDCL
jgi:hypothetical protein